MPDEPGTTSTEDAKQTDAATGPAAAEPDVRAEPERKHPLEEGGVRFNEVYGRMKAAEARATLLEHQLATKAAEPVTPAAPPVQFYTPDQLQTALDQGKITAGQMAAQLAWQAKEEAKREITQQWTADSRRQTAVAEVHQYIERVPSLNDHASAEFRRVAVAAADVAQDTGRDIRDPVVQRIALRQTFGDLNRLAKTEDTRDFDRRHADVAIETGGGGGRSRETGRDPLKDAPPALKAHWDRLNYSREQRLAEMPYVDLKRWERRR